MARKEIRSWLMDMDGVLVREELPIPGADQFLARLRGERRFDNADELVTQMHKDVELTRQLCG